MKHNKLHWVTDAFEVGNAYGYSTHNKMMKDHVSPLMELTPEADIALTIIPADKFRPVPFKHNILFSMFEADAIPETYISGFNLADELVVPCGYVKNLFRQYTSKKISVCHEGVDGNVFYYKEREFFRGQKFRILWVGAPNPRKGYPAMLELIRVLESQPGIEIYLKTTVPKVDYDSVKGKLSEADISKVKNADDIKDRLERANRGEVRPLHGLYEVMGKHNNVIFDSRNLTKQELVELYHSAHCFVFPSTGEGWGLTLCEAMATGLPAISPVHTAMQEYFDDSVGYDVSWNVSAEVDFKNYDLKAKVFIPDTNHILKRIIEIHSNYTLAKRKARKAAERMRSKFRWDQAAQRLVSIVQNVELSEVLV